MKNRHAAAQIPSATDFRSWLTAALDVTKLKPAAVSKAIEASVNSVGAFLRDPKRDITMGRASDIEQFLRKYAGDLGVDLPAIPQRAPLELGGGV